jgi:hypothetical protein
MMLQAKRAAHLLQFSVQGKGFTVASADGDGMARVDLSGTTDAAEELPALLRFDQRNERGIANRTQTKYGSNSKVDVYNVWQKQAR